MSDLPSDTRVIAEARNLEEIRLACRRRSDELKISRQTIDRISGLADGASSKLLAPIGKNFGTRALDYLLGALSLKLLVVEDSERRARLQSRYIPRDERRVNPSTHASERRPLLVRDGAWSAAMNARRTLLLSASRRRQIAQAAARARWSGEASP